MNTKVFYIFEHVDGERYFGANIAQYGYDWNYYSPEKAVRFRSYQDAKNFIRSNNTYVDRYYEEFSNCKIKKVTVSVEVSDAM